MNRKYLVLSMIVVLACAGSTAQAQSAAQTRPTAETPTSDWDVEIGIGFDNSISGNINSGAVGQINNQSVVILKNTYESVYGTGLHLRFGAGYALDDLTELRGTFAFQSLDADLVRMGDIGVSNLYGQYTDYQTLSLDFGVRRYLDVVDRNVRPYAEAMVGIGFVDKIDVTLVAPTANLSGKNNDFYDQTVAGAFGMNVGVVLQANSRVGVFIQGGFRWVSGVGQVDSLEDTSLNTINDKSARWTMPFVVGVRAGF